MIVEVSKINPDGDDLCGAVPATVLEMEQDSVFRVESPIDCRFHVQLVSHELIVRGELAVTVSFACSKCAENVSTTLRDLSFLRAYPISEGQDSVDLSADIREDILLNLPGFPVCSAGCRGLCARCGKNLNTGACDCAPGDSGGKWAALDGLRLT